MLRESCELNSAEVAVVHCGERVLLLQEAGHVGQIGNNHQHLQMTLDVSLVLDSDVGLRLALLSMCVSPGSVTIGSGAAIF